MSEQPSIFDGLEGVGRSRGYVDKPKPQKAKAYGSCPKCLSDKVGLVIQGGHLVWKDHYIATWGSVSRQCLAGGQRVCEVPARDSKSHTGITPPSCICTTD